ncbi:AfsR/SARP family transcriptional regulator [Micromonospora deserti]|uniref:AfsR/SARP family transcriptional regulator n=1 Tax=Micromonospora deserti TaxID=2070366 RepID=UPI001F3E548A|nr:hypothetical protein [Micromonospora deserti]
MTRDTTGQEVFFGVLGPLQAVASGGVVALKGPRHRAVLARLLIARGRMVPVDRLVDDLWDVPPDGAVGAIRTFVADQAQGELGDERRPQHPTAGGEDAGDGGVVGERLAQHQEEEDHAEGAHRLVEPPGQAVQRRLTRTLIRPFAAAGGIRAGRRLLPGHRDGAASPVSRSPRITGPRRCPQ